MRKQAYMRIFLIAVLSVFLATPATGQFVGAELGAALPGGSFSRATRAGTQFGAYAGAPVASGVFGTPALDISALLWIGVNHHRTIQENSQHVKGLLGPKLSYSSGDFVATGQVGGGLTTTPQEGKTAAWAVRSRVAAGVQTPSGKQVTVGPTHAATSLNRWWWGVTAALTF